MHEDTLFEKKYYFVQKRTLFVANIQPKKIAAGFDSRQYIIHDRAKTAAMNLDFPMGFPVGIFHYLDLDIETQLFLHRRI